MKKKKIIILSALIFIIIITIIIILFSSNKKNRNEKKPEINIDWEKSYINILTDNKSVENMENIEIQLCDIDKNKIPELIIYGLLPSKEYIVDIYKIDDKNNNIKTSITSKNLTDILLLYNFNRNDYIWYGVEKNISQYNINEFNVLKGEYNSETTLNGYENKYYEITENYSGKINFNKEDKEEEKIKSLELAKQRYIETDLMITDKVKLDVELAKKINNLNKIDSSKDFIYSVVEYGDYKYPAININTESVRNINNEIKEKYGFTETDAKSSQLSIKGIEQITYDYYINNNILSVLVKKGENSSTLVNSYNIDISSGEKADTTKIIENKGFNTSEVIEKIIEISEKEFNSSIEIKKSNMLQYWSTTYEKEESTWKEELNNNAKNLSNIYLNKNGELCILLDFKEPGGEWVCIKTIEINVSKGYTHSYIEYQGSSLKNNNLINQSNPEDNQNQDNPNDVPITEGAITKEEAHTLAESIWGDKSRATGFEINYSYIAIIKDEAGNEYYLYNVKWFAQNHWSWIGTIFISVDGEMYKLGDNPLVSATSGQTVTGMIEGGTF